MRRLVVAALVLASLCHDAEARRRREPRADRDDTPITRAEVAQAMLPVVNATTTDSGRQITGQDVANLETLAIQTSDQMLEEETRVARLQAEIERLRADIEFLKRRRRRHW